MDEPGLGTTTTPRPLIWGTTPNCLRKTKVLLKIHPFKIWHLALFGNQGLGCFCKRRRIFCGLGF